jgi:hypothetical protein
MRRYRDFYEFQIKKYPNFNLKNIQAKCKVELCENMLDQIVKRGFIIKNALDWLKLMTGG